MRPCSGGNGPAIHKGTDMNKQRKILGTVGAGLVLAACGVVVFGGVAQADMPARGCQPTGVALDTNADGITDQVAIDGTCDGVSDAWTFDKNQDGVVDEAAADKTGNGLPNVWAIDDTQDGVPEKGVYDNDDDGRADDFIQLQSLANIDWHKAASKSLRGLLTTVNSTTKQSGWTVTAPQADPFQSVLGVPFGGSILNPTQP
jgi:hypothetical protein